MCGGGGPLLFGHHKIRALGRFGNDGDPFLDTIKKKPETPMDVFLGSIFVEAAHSAGGEAAGGAAQGGAPAKIASLARKASDGDESERGFSGFPCGGGGGACFPKRIVFFFPVASRVGRAFIFWNGWISG